jgi:hypothetical protein
MQHWQTIPVAIGGVVAVGFLDENRIIVGSHSRVAVFDVHTGARIERTYDENYHRYQGDPPSIRRHSGDGMRLIRAAGLWGGDLDQATPAEPVNRQDTSAPGAAGTDPAARGAPPVTADRPVTRARRGRTRLPLTAEQPVKGLTTNLPRQDLGTYREDGGRTGGGFMPTAGRLEACLLIPREANLYPTLLRSGLPGSRNPPVSSLSRLLLFTRVIHRDFCRITPEYGRPPRA